MPYNHVFKPDSSKYPMRFDCPSEKEMRDGFIQVALDITTERNAYTKDEKSFYAGIELELPLITPNFQLADQAGRDSVINQFPNETSAELGAHQLEIVMVTPVNLLSDISLLEKSMETILKPIFNYIHDLGYQ